MRPWLFFVLCFSVSPVPAAAASPVIALAHANPAFKTALRAGVDNLPSQLQTPSLGLEALRANVAGPQTAQEVALALFARPEVLWYHRDEFAEILGEKRLRNLEFAVETYHEAALKDGDLRHKLVALGNRLDLTDPAYVDEVALALDQAFEKSPESAKAGPTVRATAQTSTPQGLAPSRPSQTPAAQEPPAPDVNYDEHFADSFEVDEETDKPLTFSQLLKPYLPVALMHLLMDDDDADAGDLGERAAGPGPYGPH